MSSIPPVYLPLRQFSCCPFRLSICPSCRLFIRPPFRLSIGSSACLSVLHVCTDHSPVLLFAYPPILSCVHPFVYPPILSCVDPFVYPPMLSCVHPFVYPPILSCVHPFVYPPVFSCVHPFVYPPILFCFHSPVVCRVTPPPPPNTLTHTGENNMRLRRKHGSGRPIGT